MKPREIKIAGAGISGLTAGICLAKAGYKVTIFERGNTSGERFKGDFQAIENWSSTEDLYKFLERIGISSELPLTPFDKIEIWTPHGHKTTFKGEKNALYLVKRGTTEDTLDQALLQQALSQKNLHIEFNHPINDFSEIDIVATGPIPKDEFIDGIASGYKFKTDYKDIIAMIFDDNVAHDGYGYCIIHNGEGVAISAATKDFESLNECRKSVVELIEKQLGISIQPTESCGGTANFFLANIPPDGKIYVGEAGGFQDMLWGFGIRYAMLTGYLAAKSIVENKNYYNYIAKDVTPKLKASIVNRVLFSFLTNATYPWLIRIWHTLKFPVRFLNRQYQYSKLRSKLFPLAKLFIRKNIRDPRSW